MRLIFCDECQDILKLIHKPRNCQCGKSGGKHLDRWTVDIWGKAILIGIDNYEFGKALRANKFKGVLSSFTGYITGV